MSYAPRETSCSTCRERAINSKLSATTGRLSACCTEYDTYYYGGVQDDDSLYTADYYELALSDEPLRKEMDVIASVIAKLTHHSCTADITCVDCHKQPIAVMTRL